MSWIEGFVEELHQMPDEWFLWSTSRYEVRAYKGNKHLCYCDSLYAALFNLNSERYIIKL
jgi:hypothetical protein